MAKESFQNFSLKFVDIMIGVVLGLGFQWWADLREPWQYAAFIFAYLSLIDYWIDYSPTLKRFPPRHELDLITHLIITFSMFLLVYSTRGTLSSFFIAFMVYRIADIWWTANILHEYKPTPENKIFIETWFGFDIIEAAGAGVLLFVSRTISWFHPLLAILIFILFRITTRVLTSVRYRKIFFA